MIDYERLADYLYAEYTGRDLEARMTSVNAGSWVRFARAAVKYAEE